MALSGSLAVCPFNGGRLANVRAASQLDKIVRIRIIRLRMNTRTDFLPARVVCRGTVHVRLSVERALPLFTPRGERRWVAGWDPSFPADDADDTAPGTVFLTGESIWMVADRTERSMRYARALPGVWAGTVEVRCEPVGSQTAAEVTYDLTVLDSAQRPRLREFADGYDAFLREWEREIGAALRDGC
jgi:hypothetical protein